MKINLPVLRMRMLPELRCTQCGQLGYIDEKAGRCAACWNISLLRYAQRARQKIGETPK